jgi:pyruvate-ferredoxin/flavodoxin oxidoreductase
MGYNMQGVIKALKEAEEHNGPSIIIAYSSCIAHGIVGGLSNSLEIQKLATTCGYFPTFRYVPESKKFTLDSTKVDFDRYEEFLNSQNRYRMLKNINPTMASSLLEGNKEDSKKRFDYYKKLDEESKKEI